ncbi:MAG: hypothetical protein WD278_05510 [Pirellulales bacterium]
MDRPRSNAALSGRLRRATRLAALALGLPVIWGCNSGSSRLLQPGEKAPPLKAAGWLNGPAPTADELAGNLVVVDIWAYW